MIEDCIETLTKGEVWEDKYLEYFWSNSILGGDADGGLFLLPWISRGNGTKCVGEYSYRSGSFYNHQFVYVCELSLYLSNHHTTVK